MNKCLISICLHIFFSSDSIVLAQNKAIIYEYTITKNTKVDIKDKNSNLPFTNAQLDKINRVLNETKEIFRLTVINDKSSYIFSESKTPSDIKTQGTISLIADYYKDHKLKKLFLTGGNNLMNKCVDESYKDLNNWELVDFDTIVYNLPCKKAVEKNTKSVAYYTKQIPVPDGPEHFADLPGLIVLIKTFKKTIKLTNIIKEDNSNPLKLPNDCKNKISFWKYYDEHDASKDIGNFKK
ncbi:MAG: GLPGLI family protein [Saprospiraceae bacterium]